MPDEVTLPPHPASVGRARRFVQDELATLGVPDPGASAELLVSELVTNAVVHAGTDIVVRVGSDDAGARVEVADGSLIMPGLRIADTKAFSGRGLALVAHFAREWGVDRLPSGKIVWFVVGRED